MLRCPSRPTPSRFSQCNARHKGTAPARIFSDPGSAAFLSAVGPSSPTLPVLNGLPEIIVTGRGNCGKSTLLNALLGRRALLHASKKAGRTRELNFFRVGAHPGHLIIVDAPGYGARGRPEWGTMLDNYIASRQQLRRVYILFNAKHALSPADTTMLKHLSHSLVTPRPLCSRPFTLQAVITKADNVPPSALSNAIDKLRQDIWTAAPLCLPAIITSAHMSPPFGIEEMRQNVAEACDLV